MRKGLAVEALGDLLDLPLLAVLATYREDGSVLLSPVWHEYKDGGFNICTDDAGVKVRHLRRDPRASVVVAEPAPPWRGVELAGEATLTSEGVAAVAERVAIRYLGEEKGRAFARSSRDNVLVRLERGRLRTWDFADVQL
jgi:PPOX class probable F420-dependent enzyme